MAGMVFFRDRDRNRYRGRCDSTGTLPVDVLDGGAKNVQSLRSKCHADDHYDPDTDTDTDADPDFMLFCSRSCLQLPPATMHSALTPETDDDR